MIQSPRFKHGCQRMANSDNSDDENQTSESKPTGNASAMIPGNSTLRGREKSSQYGDRGVKKILNGVWGLNCKQISELQV